MTSAGEQTNRGDTPIPNEEILRSLWDTRLEGLANVGDDGIIRHANPGFCQLFSHGDRTIGMPMRRLYLTDVDWAHCEAVLRDDPPVWQGTLRFARADGSVMLAHVTIARIARDTFEPPLLSVTVRDAAEQTRRESELRAMTERLELNLAATPLAVVEWDVEGRIAYWNRSAERIFGYGPAEVLGKPFLPLIVPNLAQDQVKGIVAALLDGNFANSRNVNVTKDGR